MYLRKYAEVSDKSEDRVTMKVVCDCGCHEFYFFGNCVDQKEIEKREQLRKRFDRFGEFETYLDPETNINYLVKRNIFEKIKDKIPVSELPDFENVHIIKTKCADCGNEIVLFDSRYHGYNAVVGNISESKRDVQYEYSQLTNERCQAEIQIIHDIEYDEFIEEFGENLSTEYSSAFGYITIYAIDEKARKHRLFEEETE